MTAIGVTALIVFYVFCSVFTALQVRHQRHAAEKSARAPEDDEPDDLRSPRS